MLEMLSQKHANKHINNEFQFALHLW